jgi:hypothetical protein
MSDEYEAMLRWMRRWRAAGDRERLHMANLQYEAWECHEADPERSFALYTRGRDEALRLQETWWVLFYESWRLNALTSFAMNFGRALPVAMELTIRINAKENRRHEWRTSILTNVLYTFLNIDPIGYRDELERGFAHLDEIVPSGADNRRLVLNHRRASYLSETDRFDEAYDVAIRSLGLADQFTEKSMREWHGAWTLYGLCRICDALGKAELLGGHAEHMAELSQRRGQLSRAKAAAWCWKAVSERMAGNEHSAARFLHMGLRILRNLERRDTICADPLSRYYELAGDVQAAVSIRDREIADLVEHGRLHRICQMQIERCRLLATMGILTAADIAEVRVAAARLRVPEWCLNKLNRSPWLPTGFKQE